MDWLVATGKSTQAFVIDQAPDVARQMIEWEIWKSWFWLVPCALLALLGLLIFVLSLTSAMGKNGNNDDCGVAFFSCVGFLLFFLLAVYQGTRIVKCHVAPKVFILEEAVDMAKCRQR